MIYENVVVELDGTRNTQDIIDEFTSHGATVSPDETDPDVLYVSGVPHDLVDYVEGIAEYAPFDGDTKDMLDTFEAIQDEEL